MTARQIVANEGARFLSFTFAELFEGDRCTETVLISQSMVDEFINISGDSAPVHVDEAHAREMNQPSRIAHGLLTTLRFSRLLGMFLPGVFSVIHSIKFEFIRPVLVGDEITYSLVVTRLSAAARLAVLELEARRDGEVCVRGTAQCVLAK